MAAAMSGRAMAGAMSLPDLASAGWDPATTTIPVTTTAIIIPATAIVARLGIAACASAGGKSAAGGDRGFGGQPAPAGHRAVSVASIEHLAEPERNERCEYQDRHEPMGIA